MFLQGLSAQLGRVLPSQRGPWKPGVQRQEKVPGLFTQVPPLRHSAEAQWSMLVWQRSPVWLRGQVQE